MCTGVVRQRQTECARALFVCSMRATVCFYFYTRALCECVLCAARSLILLIKEDSGGERISHRHRRPR